MMTDLWQTKKKRVGGSETGSETAAAAAAAAARVRLGGHQSATEGSEIEGWDTYIGSTVCWITLVSFVQMSVFVAIEQSIAVTGLYCFKFCLI